MLLGDLTDGARQEYIAYSDKYGIILSFRMRTEVKRSLVFFQLFLYLRDMASCGSIV